MVDDQYPSDPRAASLYDTVGLMAITGEFVLPENPSSVISLLSKRQSARA